MLTSWIKPSPIAQTSITITGVKQRPAPQGIFLTFFAEVKSTSPAALHPSGASAINGMIHLQLSESNHLKARTGTPNNPDSPNQTVIVKNENDVALMSALNEKCKEFLVADEQRIINHLPSRVFDACISYLEASSRTEDANAIRELKDKHVDKRDKESAKHLERVHGKESRPYTNALEKAKHEHYVAFVADVFSGELKHPSNEQQRLLGEEACSEIMQSVKRMVLAEAPTVKQKGSKRSSLLSPQDPMIDEETGEPVPGTGDGFWLNTTINKKKFGETSGIATRVTVGSRAHGEEEIAVSPEDAFDALSKGGGETLVNGEIQETNSYLATSVVQLGVYYVSANYFTPKVYLMLQHRRAFQQLEEANDAPVSLYDTLGAALGNRKDERVSEDEKEDDPSPSPKRQKLAEEEESE